MESFTQRAQIFLESSSKRELIQASLSSLCRTINTYKSFDVESVPIMSDIVRTQWASLQVKVLLFLLSPVFRIAQWLWLNRFVSPPSSFSKFTRRPLSRHSPRASSVCVHISDIFHPGTTVVTDGDAGLEWTCQSVHDRPTAKNMNASCRFTPWCFFVLVTAHGVPSFAAPRHFFSEKYQKLPLYFVWILRNVTFRPINISSKNLSRIHYLLFNIHLVCS